MLDRSFPGGAAVGSVVVAWGGDTGSITTFTTEVNRTTGGVCLSPTPTVTGTPPTAIPSNTPPSMRTPTTTRTPTPTPSCDQWGLSPSPASERLVNIFYGVAVASPNDV